MEKKNLVSFISVFMKRLSYSPFQNKNLSTSNLRKVDFFLIKINWRFQILLSVKWFFFQTYHIFYKQPPSFYTLLACRSKKFIYLLRLLLITLRFSQLYLCAKLKGKFQEGEKSLAWNTLYLHSRHKTLQSVDCFKNSALTIFTNQNSINLDRFLVWRELSDDDKRSNWLWHSSNRI